MRRLFCERIPGPGELAALDSATLKHARVLRLRDGDEVALFDGQGNCGRARMTDRGAEVFERTSVPPPDSRVVLLLALAKGPAMDVAIRMCTELGASEVRIAPATRSVPNARDARRRLERWETIARGATRQSERWHATKLEVFASLEEAMSAPATATRCVAWARGGSRAADMDLSSERWVAIGPEGGFTDDELAAFDAAGWSRLALAPHVLRVDTAAVAAISALLPFPPGA